MSRPIWTNKGKMTMQYPRFNSYAEKLADTLSAQHDNLPTVPLGSGTPTTVQEIIDTIAGFASAMGEPLQGRGEFYVELDPAMLGELCAEMHAGRPTFAWPAVLRVDENGDLILTVTSGDFAQFGHQE